MADETRLSDSISSLNEEEGKAPSPPEMDLIVEQDSSTSTSTSTSTTKSSRNDVIFQEDQHPDSDSSSAAIPKSPTATATSNGDGELKSKGKETPFSAKEEEKEEDQESAKLNGESVGRLPVGGILGFSEEAENEKGEFGNGRKRSLQLGSTASSLEIQLIDETALIGLISIPKPKPKPKPKLAFKKNEDMAKAKKTKTNKSNTRRRENEGVKTKKKKEEERGKMMRYSRERMEALRFVNVVEQRRMWKGVYLGLGPLVRKEYDFLLSSRQHCNNYIHFIFPHDQTHLHQQGNKIHSSSDFGIIAARGRWNHVNVYVH